MFAAFFSAFLLSLTCSTLLYIMRGPLLGAVRRTDLLARQACHIRPTLRLGGLGVAFGTICSVAYFGKASAFEISLVLLSMPVVVIGFLEDVGVHQSPKMRLAVTVYSGAMVIWVLDLAITRLGIPLLDPVFGLQPVFVMFTIFATTGVVHAFNLVDGLNGFAGANALVSIGTLVGIAAMIGDTTIGLMSLALIGAILGFLVFNFPGGRLFLGDAGAYFIGFLLAWMAVHLIATAPDLTPWAVLLVFFWPVADTLLAIFRRGKRGMPTAHADRLHAHHVVMRGIEIAILGRRDRTRSNPLATVTLVPFLLPPPLAALAFWNEPLAAAVATALFALLFVLSYFCGVFFLRKMRSRRLFRRIPLARPSRRYVAGRKRMGRSDG